MEMSGAEWDTVGVQRPVCSTLLVLYESGACWIDGCSEGLGCVTRKVVDVQVV